MKKILLVSLFAVSATMYGSGQVAVRVATAQERAAFPSGLAIAGAGLVISGTAQYDRTYYRDIAAVMGSLPQWFPDGTEVVLFEETTMKPMAASMYTGTPEVKRKKSKTATHKPSER